MQTTVIFKTDKKLKVAAQATAKRMGVPFSAVLNGFMKDFVEKQEMSFSGKPLKLTPYGEKLLNESEEDLKNGNVDVFKSVEDLIKDLES
jgi:addiction module RelB/DinJ family antitoxin